MGAEVVVAFLLPLPLLLLQLLPLLLLLLLLHLDHELCFQPVLG
jgi:hypothetical protein